ncbi:MAG: hypothetical protein ACT4PX_03100 [Actinomycetota bacterium]
MRKGLVAGLICAAALTANVGMASAASDSACNDGTERAHATVQHEHGRAHDHIPHCTAM